MGSQFMVNRTCAGVNRNHRLPERPACFCIGQLPLNVTYDGEVYRLDPECYDSTVRWILERPQERPAVRSRRIDDEFRNIVLLLALMWFVVLADRVVLFIQFPLFAIVPRTAWGILGIFAAPWIHISFLHVLGVTPPLAAMLAWLARRGISVWGVVLQTAILAGVLTWLFGRSHIVYLGASGLLFGLATGTAVEGLLARKPAGLLLGLAVAGIYGGLTWLELLPDGDPPMTWDCHAWGAIAGLVVGLVQVVRRRRAEAGIVEAEIVG